MLVFVVGHQAVGPTNGGGFDWFPGSERSEAVAKVVELVNHSDVRHSVTFVPIDVPRTDPVEINRWISERPELIAVSKKHRGRR